MRIGFTWCFVAAEIYPCATPYLNDVCYWAITELGSYDDALTSCAADGGTLAMIFDESIATFLV